MSRSAAGRTITTQGRMSEQTMANKLMNAPYNYLQAVRTTAFPASPHDVSQLFHGRINSVLCAIAARKLTVQPPTSLVKPWPITSGERVEMVCGKPASSLTNATGWHRHTWTQCQLQAAVLGRAVHLPLFITIPSQACWQSWPLLGQGKQSKSVWAGTSQPRNLGNRRGADLVASLVNGTNGFAKRGIIKTTSPKE